MKQKVIMFLNYPNSVCESAGKLEYGMNMYQT